MNDATFDASYDALTTSQHNTTQHNTKRAPVFTVFHGSRVVAEPMKPREPRGVEMNRTETTELLRARRELTRETYNDETVAAWQYALADDDYEQCRDALNAAAREATRVAVPDLVAQLPRPSDNAPKVHASSCMCAGRGWIEVEQHDNRGGSWLAWDRCPNGPRTGFVEVD